MALFGRRRREGEEPVADTGRTADGVDDLDGDDEDDYPTPVQAPEGPYDEADAPDDDFPRLDLGSVRIPVPDGAQLQVEMDPAGPVRAVHVLTPVGQVTLNAYAAPRSGGLWREVCGELAEQLRGDGAAVRSHAGEWGQELGAALGEVSLRFVGVDGPRWMLRGVVAGPPELADTSAQALRELVRNTVVVRGDQPMPVRTPLQIDLPKAIADHIAEQAEQQQ
ncbi:DUF3710 domain-containing protein [Actinokineospora sp. NBRC 105648]|uniref:DUF3710 domain-containing protein n=1 Tax=Actinokineospora sp. NBRC 105648 TaxID=3032206 RepID=UPI0024A2FABF|nr:DUF3710 domain-containing protein [Actinokineospora sp. NBRC 105648]GLZ38762.1 hypothetical protein Acsp05_23860 [Actinokineospora sp. NBRC 105648]